MVAKDILLILRFQFGVPCGYELQHPQSVAVGEVNELPLFDDGGT
jgi:hypothetical protein